MSRRELRRTGVMSSVPEVEWTLVEGSKRNKSATGRGSKSGSGTNR